MKNRLLYFKSMKKITSILILIFILNSCAESVTEKIMRKSENNPVGKVLHLKDADIYYEVYGKGKPLFLLHGNGGSIDAFTKEIPELSKHFMVIAMDTRAQGKSTDTSTEPLSYRKFADDVKALSDYLHLKKINIFGWSDGGNTAIEFAIKYPKNLRKFITSGANVFPLGVGKEEVENMKKDLAQMVAENKPKNDIRLLQLMIDEPKISKEQLNKIKSKALIIAGDHDIILRSHTEYIAKEIPKATMKIYKNATHSIPIEHSEELNKDIEDFLK
ncbi:Pimeloyl-ACP methyl ester carboxylesterase [Halpernia humi]|uniref:Pimeloyl-ACP methyl ester carboxylesterase n=1 Tax=Halpernia humi TaxID=493375 RepID=A0A1H5Z5S3_9FLAO|nr:alpha/beta hydrolase [Halpernia humi]SEG31708.1 Pimeloyl-ACP methyl ester carboxylesterase [Halpernia humi]